jgi:hypothetical protein
LIDMTEQPAARTIVSFLLDRTGSMDAIKAETIGGFNAYLDALERDAGDDIEFTLLQFDSVSIDTLYRGVRLCDVPRLTTDTYQPRAYTPLIDACVKTVKATEEAIAQHRDKARVIVVFQTDGEENASREHSLAELRDLIERRKAEGWQFVFLGADIDAYSAARNLGILEEATLAYSGKQSLAGMTALAEESARFARGGARQVRFSQRQKRAAGDQRPRLALKGYSTGKQPVHPLAAIWLT